MPRVQPFQAGRHRHFHFIRVHEDWRSVDPDASLENSAQHSGDGAASLLAFFRALVRDLAPACRRWMAGPSTAPSRWPGSIAYRAGHRATPKAQPGEGAEQIEAGGASAPFRIRRESIAIRGAPPYRLTLIRSRDLERLDLRRDPAHVVGGRSAEDIERISYHHTALA